MPFWMKAAIVFGVASIAIVANELFPEEAAHADEPQLEPGGPSQPLEIHSNTTAFINNAVAMNELRQIAKCNLTSYVRESSGRYVTGRASVWEEILKYGCDLQ